MVSSIIIIFLDHFRIDHDLKKTLKTENGINILIINSEIATMPLKLSIAKVSLNLKYLKFYR